MRHRAVQFDAAFRAHTRATVSVALYAISGPPAESLDAACMNIGAAADDSLHKIFPGSPEFDSILDNSQLVTHNSQLAMMSLNVQH
jgi:hypothetical protein